ncbi:Hsp20 family protein [bacterium]|nr:Hsp20 family protein [bacterium]
MREIFSNSEETLFGRSIDDYLFYEGFLFSEKVAHEFDDRYIVEISVPGFKPDNLELHIEDDSLILRGFDVEKRRRLFWTQITKSTIFQRTLVMPADVAPNTISAHYQPGLVQVVCPRQIIPFGHYRNHYLVQKRKIKIQNLSAGKNWWQRLWSRS